MEVEPGVEGQVDNALSLTKRRRFNRLSKEKAPWKMQAPEPTLCGNVRPRADLEEHPVNLESQMVAEPGVEIQGEDALSLTKRRRVVGSLSAREPMTVSIQHGFNGVSLLPLPISHEGLNDGSSTTRDPLPQQNIMGECMLSGVLPGAEESNLSPAVSFSSVVEGGAFCGFFGSLLNFQNPLGLDPLTSGRPTLGAESANLKKPNKKKLGSRGAAGTMELRSLPFAKNGLPFVSHDEGETIASSISNNIVDVISAPKPIILPAITRGEPSNSLEMLPGLTSRKVFCG
ncbi:hypothetical protein M0R45_021869 [Rubus argutus]|uniref:Uncharacterized protein n=1 Tax=Rubus argutus TaxID=59490 RepID=A0AAW1XE99_RUBAR